MLRTRAASWSGFNGSGYQSIKYFNQLYKSRSRSNFRPCPASFFSFNPILPRTKFSRYSNIRRARPDRVFNCQVSRSCAPLIRESDSSILRGYFHAHHPAKIPCQNSLSPWSLVAIFSVVVIVSVLGAGNIPINDRIETHNNTQAALVEKFSGETIEMAGETTTGRSGSLTPEQEEKLKELWTATFQVFGVLDDATGNTSAETKGKADATNPKKSKKKRISLFRRNKDEDEEPTPAPGTGGSKADDKFGQMKVFNEALASMSPEALRTTLWSMIKHDNPDALLLRFLRARQWNIEKALVMLISTMRWRLIEAHIDDDVIKNGELHALNESAESDPARRKLGKDFLDQMRLGKSFVHGTDKKGRPLCLVRVRQHKIGEQSEESLERFTVYLIESARMILASPVDTASVVFDMTGFSMSNMDYSPVKFMIKCFEANYPECLGVILVHKAPWVFQGIWKIIRGWLDPVVASKVHFTNNTEEMEEFVSRSQILKELGGDEDWIYKYVEPVPGENDKMKDTESRDKLLKEREKIVDQYEKATLEWIHATGAESSAIEQRREEIAKSLRLSYWDLDPYIRARTYYDRIGVLNPGGIINHYPSNTEDSVTSESKATEET